MRLRLSARYLSIVIASTLPLLPVVHAETPAVHAETLSYGVDAGVGESDNVTLAPTDKVSQTIAATDLDFAYERQGRRLDVEAKGDFTYLDYLQHAYRSQFIGGFNGLGQFALIPGRLVWELQDSFGEAQIDPFSAVTPTNQERINYVSTGPDLALRLGPTGFVDVTARYARAQYEVSPFDSNRLSGTVAVGMQLSARSSVSINGSTARVLFDNTVENTDFDRSSGYGHYELHGARTDLTANLGITQVKRGGQSINGGLAKLELSRKLSSAAKLTFAVGRELTDGSSSFGGQSGGFGTTPGTVGTVSTIPGGASGISTVAAAQTSSNYTATHASVDWQYVRNRTTFGLSGRWEKDSYQGQPLLNLARSNAEFRIEQKLTRVLSAQLLGSIYRTNYANTDFAETDGRIGGALTFREGRGLEIRLRCDHTSRIVSGIGSGTGYTENRAFLTIGYRPRPAGPST